MLKIALLEHGISIPVPLSFFRIFAHKRRGKLKFSPFFLPFRPPPPSLGCLGGVSKNLVAQQFSFPSFFFSLAFFTVGHILASNANAEPPFSPSPRFFFFPCTWSCFGLMAIYRVPPPSFPVLLYSSPYGLPRSVLDTVSATNALKIFFFPFFSLPPLLSTFPLPRSD